MSGDDVVRLESERVDRVGKEKAIDEGPWWGRLVSMWSKWMTGQAFNNVLLLLILVAIGAGFWFGGKYCINVAIPSHIEMIQTGYEREGQANRELIRELDDNHRQERKEWTSLLDRVLNASQTVSK